MLFLGPWGHARQIISVISPRCLLFSFSSICTGGEDLVPQQGVFFLASTPSKIHVISLPVLDEGIEMIFFGTEDRVKIPILKFLFITNDKITGS